MFYFVPSWYRQDRKWYSNALPFFYASKNMMFDDAVNLLRMFQQSNEETTALILNYSPQIRTFFYQQKMDTDDIWSLFDTIQGVTDVVQRKIRLADLKWPQGAELYYTPFIVDIEWHGEKYAQVNFSQVGNIYDITYFKDEKIDYQLIFDDRGFVSSIIYFNDGQAHYQDYLDFCGEWRLREYLLDENHQVHVNSKFNHLFQKEIYSDIEELVQEKIVEHLDKVLTVEDSLIISADSQHNYFFQEIKQHHSIIYSFFGERYPIDDVERLINDLKGTPFVVVDTFKKLERISESIDIERLPACYEISPYNTQLSLGHSQRKKELILYLNFDNLPSEQGQYIFTTLFDLMLKNEWIDLVVGTQSQEYGREAYIKQTIEAFRSNNPDYEQLEFVKKGPEGKDIVLDDEKPLRERIDICSIYSDTDMAKALKYVRLILDFGNPADVLTQIAGISVGIPQINLSDSSYVKHGENGWILEGISELEQAILYYFTDLQNWNQSLVHSVKKIEQYTKGEIVDMWKNIIKGINVNEKN